MTELEKLQIKTLLWKEWKQIRVFVALAVLIIAAFGGMAVFDEIDLADSLPKGAVLASVLTTLGLGVLAYGLEVNEKTMSYLATRPVTHRQVFLVKVGLSLTVGWAVALTAWFLCSLLDSSVFAFHTDFFGEGFDLLIARWWLYVPATYATVLAWSLMVRPIVPSLIVSICAGLYAIWLSATDLEGLVILWGAGHLWEAYLLASRRLHTEGA